MKQQWSNGYEKRNTFILLFLFLLFTVKILSRAHIVNAGPQQAQVAGALSENDKVYFFSSATVANIGIVVSDEDIVSWSELNGWSAYMDGSDVGLNGATDVDAFHINEDGTILLSFAGSAKIPDVGTVDGSDIIRFIPTSLGDDTVGDFEWYFDGSDVGLETNNDEDIDALTVLPNGDLLLSTSGITSVPGLSDVGGEDILRFSHTSLGASTAGTFDLKFDGSKFGLEDESEDIGGIWIDDISSEIYLTTKGDFLVAGASGLEKDVFKCIPVPLDPQAQITSCTFALEWVGGNYGFGKLAIDGLMMSLPAATSTPMPTATDTPVPTATNTPPPTSTNTPVPPSATNTPPPTATNTPLPTATNTSIPPTATSEPGATDVKINFQIAGSTVPGGYLPDYGEIYGVRNGQTYGWNSDHSDVTRDRNVNSDQRLDTLSHFHSGGVFEIAVANGTYNITVSVGDASYPSTHTINVEGVSYWNTVSLAANQFLVKTEQIVVSDGRVTIDQGDLIDKQTRINYVEITSISAAATATPANTSVPPTATNTPLPTATDTPVPPTATVTPGSSSSGFENCVSVTGSNAIVGVPADVVINGGFLPAPGDQLAVFSPDGAICTGLATWTGSNIAITVWGDDSQTAVLDGMLSGEKMVFRIWDQSTATEFAIGVAEFSLGDGIYLPDSMHVVSALTLSMR